jgi:hypothetical protein
MCIVSIFFFFSDITPSEKSGASTKLVDQKTFYLSCGPVVNNTIEIDRGMQWGDVLFKGKRVIASNMVFLQDRSGPKPRILFGIRQGELCSFFRPSTGPAVCILINL